MIVPLRRGLVKFQPAAEAYWPVMPQKYVQWKVSITKPSTSQRLHIIVKYTRPRVVRVLVPPRARSLAIHFPYRWLKTLCCYRGIITYFHGCSTIRIAPFHVMPALPPTLRNTLGSLPRPGSAPHSAFQSRDGVTGSVQVDSICPTLHSRFRVPME